jgi:hypothetical protein
MQAEYTQEEATAQFGEELKGGHPVVTIGNAALPVGRLEGVVSEWPSRGREHSLKLEPEEDGSAFEDGLQVHKVASPTLQVECWYSMDHSSGHSRTRGPTEHAHVQNLPGPVIET